MEMDGFIWNLCPKPKSFEMKSLHMPHSALVCAQVSPSKAGNASDLGASDQARLTLLHELRLAGLDAYLSHGRNSSRQVGRCQLTLVRALFGALWL
jgi:hypothetical protein